MKNHKACGLELLIIPAFLGIVRKLFKKDT